MIKQLKKRFIIVAMAAVSVLLIVLLGAINIFSIVITNSQINRTMEFLAQRSFMSNSSLPPVNRFEGNPNVSKDFFGKPMDDDTAKSSRHFAVFLDNENNIVYTNTNQISSVNEQEATEIAQKVITQNKFYGYISEFKYTTIVSDNIFPSYNQVMIFLDVSNQYQSIVAVLFLSLILGSVAWGLMLLLVLFMSEKAIKPIAENIQQQKMFITNAGHEIKTPLAIISANTEALELHQGESKWSKNIKGQTNRLSELMQNLLLLSKADEGIKQQGNEEIQLNVLLKEIVLPYEDTLTESNRSILFDVDDINYTANKENVTQLFSVLINNAVEYSVPDTVIYISLKKTNKVYFTIRNQCEQLPLVSPERLFDRFYRGDSARTQSSGGYGIGLSVARAVAEGLDGRIWAKYFDNNIIEFTVEL